MAATTSRASLRALLAGALLLCLVSPLRSRPATPRVQDPTPPLTFTYDVVKHSPNIPPDSSGCRPDITPLGVAFDPDGKPVVAWRNGAGCGLPFPSATDRGQWVATKEGTWQATVMNDALCQFGRCSEVRRSPAFALRPDGNPFFVFGGPDPGGYWLHSIDMTSGPATPLWFLGASQSILSLPLVAASFSANQLNWAWVPEIGGTVVMNGEALPNAHGVTWLDVAGSHVAFFGSMLGQSGSGVIYADRRVTPSGVMPPTIVMPVPSSNSNGGAIAIATDDTPHIIHAGGPVGRDASLMYLVRIGSTWMQEYVDEHAMKPEIAIGADGQPAVVYWSGNGTDLWLARRNLDGTWAKALVATTPGGHGGVRPQIAFDPGGNPHVLYYNNVTHDVILASGRTGPQTEPGFLTVTKAGAGTGTVTSLPSGISCGIDCNEAFVRGTTVVLTATPDAGSVFAGWTGACTTIGPCVVTLDAAASVAAMFHPVKPGATIEVAGGCTLADAIVAANTDAAAGFCEAGTGADTILLPSGTLTFSSAYPGNPSFDTRSALPLITSEMTIAGAGETDTILERSGPDQFRFFHVMGPNGKLTLRDITLRNGHAGSDRGGAVLDRSITIFERVTFDANRSDNDGGAIWSDGETTIRSSLFTGNRTSFSGGGARIGTGTVERSRFLNNVTSFTGGALFINAGTVTETEFTDNVVNSQGGALNVGSGAVTVVRSTMTGNSTQSGNGGAISAGGGSLTLIDSWLTANRSAGHGGAMLINGARVTISGSTFDGNIAAGHGGAIYAASPTVIRNSTFSDNRAEGTGGAIMTDGPLDLRNVTISGNHATNVGGGLRWEPRNTPVTLANTILAGNTSTAGYPDCYAWMPMTSEGYNILGNNDGCLFAATVGDRVGAAAAPIDPKLQALNNNGGPTPTRALMDGSPAINAGSPETPGSAPNACDFRDQRGNRRPQRSACDIGAYERSNRAPIAAPQTLSTDDDSPLTVTLIAIDPDGDPLTLAIVTPPARGTLSGMLPELVYTPAQDFDGVDSLTFAGTDSFGATGTPATVTITVVPVGPPAPAVIDIVEQIAVTDTPVPLPSAFISINEHVGVTDTPDTTTVAPAVINVVETVAVADTPMPLPAALININEHVGVADASNPMTVAPAVINVVETVAVADTPMPLPAALININEHVGVADASNPMTVAPAVINVVETVAVADTPVPLPAALINITEAVGVSDASVPVPGPAPVNTPPGQNVVVDPKETNGAPTPVRVTFSNVTTGGDTKASSAAGPPPPQSFEPGTPPMVFDITTTATFTGLVVVCIDHAGVTFPGTEPPKLFHYENGAWQDKTTSSTPTTKCGTVTSLSPFALFAPIDVFATEGRMSGAGRIDGDDGREHSFTFIVAERSIGDERGKVRYSIRTPKAGKQKERIDRFESTSIGPIVFWDNPAFAPGRGPRPTTDSVVFSGTGTWNGVAGFTFEAAAADLGEPGRGRDTFSITVRDGHGVIVATVTGTLDGGNVQSQRLAVRRADRTSVRQDE